MLRATGGGRGTGFEPSPRSPEYSVGSGRTLGVRSSNGCVRPQSRAPRLDPEMAVTVPQSGAGDPCSASGTLPKPSLHSAGVGLALLSL